MQTPSLLTTLLVLLLVLLSLAVAMGARSLSKGRGGLLPMLLGLGAAAASYAFANWWIRHRSARPTSALSVLMILIASA